MYKELDFSLDEIKSIINNPDFELKNAMTEQIKILSVKRKHIDNLINLAQTILNTGGNNMDFKPFNHNKSDKYKDEVISKWNNTKEYKEFESKSLSPDEENNIEIGLSVIFVKFGEYKNNNYQSEDVQNLVKELQDYITSTSYTCTNQILSYLGQMYVFDERFKTNIDNVGGDGTAEFVNKAIEYYCK